MLFGLILLLSSAALDAPNGRTANSDADYPADALRKHQEGTVKVKLTINVEGRVAACEVDQSSGVASLDKATCDMMTKRARFKPETGDDGKPKEGSTVATMRWVIPK